MSDDERTIRELHVRWIAAVNAGELDGLLGWVTDDVVLAGPGQALVGRDAYAAKFAEAQRQFRIECASELDEVEVVGDVAYTRSCDTLAVAPREGGETMRLAGRRMTIYRKQRDGRWLLARDLHNLAPSVDDQS